MSSNPKIKLEILADRYAIGQMRRTARRVIRRIRKRWAPPIRMATKLWADTHLYLPPENTDQAGRFSTRVTPYTTSILDAIDDPKVHKVVCMKSSQVGWTMGVLMPSLGKKIHINPSAAVIMFPKEGQAREFSQEKFAPTIDATPVLSERVDTSARKNGNSILFKKFPGGFLKLVGSNSPASVKSTSAPFLAIEEPDDCNLNVRNQGNSIDLLQDRAKTFQRHKIIIGGTPSLKGLSSIEHELESSDYRELHVACHDCDEEHVLSWDNVSWDENADIEHRIYGKSQPETAHYACPHCGSLWNDWRKNDNVRKACEAKRWIARYPFRGIAGFRINELYSPFPGSVLAKLVERYLKAKAKEAAGDLGPLIAFTNSVLGESYEYQSDSPEAEELEARALKYSEKTVPNGGLILTAGVDIQHDRIAIAIRAWGRGEESWLVWFDEIYGNPIDKHDAVWDELDHILSAPYPHEKGVSLYIQAASIDASDGHTSEPVYHFVRPRQRRGIMAIKGAARDSITAEIFSKPRESVDTNYKNSKAAKYGLRPHVVGTHKAKTLIDGKLGLTGHGPGTMHWYKDVRADYCKQLVSEVLAPHPRRPKDKVWQLKSGERNEALDCEVYALHASYSLKVHLLKATQWDAIEQKLMQTDLFPMAAGSDITPASPKKTESPPRKQAAAGGAGSWL